MPCYIATFTIRLPTPVLTDATYLPRLDCRTGLQTPVTLVSLVPVIERGRIARLKCEVTYERDDLKHLSASRTGTAVTVIAAGGYIGPPPIDAAPVVRQVLYHLSGATLQAEIFHPLEDDLEEHVEEFHWHLPGGELAQGRLSYPLPAMLQLRDQSRRLMNLNDWKMVQGVVAGLKSSVPLWRMILAAAHRERKNDISHVTLRCAMALDVGVASFLSRFSKREKMTPLEVLRGEKNVQTPDLRSTDGRLFDEIAQLWYTRHAIIHLGRAEVFDKRPSDGIASVGPLEPQHADRWLVSVPTAMEYLVRNPP